MTVIREVVDGDIDALAHVHTRSWQVAYRGQLPDDLLDRLDPGRRADAWRNLRDQEGPSVLAAFDGRGETSRLLGFVCVGASRDDDADSDCGELQAIYVDPDHWGSGYGSELLRRGVQRLREDGYRRATLWVLETHVAAHRFYEHRGWRQDGAAKTQEARGLAITEIRYSLDLTS